MRDTTFTLTKAIAIILVVVSHAGAPVWLNRFIFQFHVPIFFLCAGYFFRPEYLEDGRRFVAHRFQRLYLPFVKWSLFFLVIHNLLFPLGLLSETYGNAAGGVLHPYTWHDFCQRCWNVVFNMSGYDEFICGAFWFFRTLLVSSLAFLVGMKLLRRLQVRVAKDVPAWQTPVLLAAVCCLLIIWKIGGNLRLTGIAGGGYRELLGVIFLCLGYLYRLYHTRIPSSVVVPLVCVAVTVLGAWLFPSSMAPKADYAGFFGLLLPAVGGFGMVHALSHVIHRRGGWIERGLVYIGDRTLYIFAFHLLAFKVVSAVKVACYGLPYQRMGEHTVVHEAAGDAFWVLYVVVGVGLPLAWLALYRYLQQHYDLSLKNCLRVLWRWSIVALRALLRGCVKAAKALRRCIMGFFRSMVDIVKASSPKEE
jgi:fucose 4-O-acetylase-like acetyltransferase